MKVYKNSFFGRVVGAVLGGVIGATSFSSLSLKVNHTNSVDQKQSEQLYRTKTGKCCHKEGCFCLKNSKIKVQQEEIKEAELKTCKRCCKTATD